MWILSTFRRSGSFSSSLKAPGNSSSLSGKSNFRNNSNRTRTPFHKRYIKIKFSVERQRTQNNRKLCHSSEAIRNLRNLKLTCNVTCRSESSLSRSKDCRFSNEPTSSKKFNIRFVIFFFFFCFFSYNFLINYFFCLEEFVLSFCLSFFFCWQFSYILFFCYWLLNIHHHTFHFRYSHPGWIYKHTYIMYIILLYTRSLNI